MNIHKQLAVKYSKVDVLLTYWDKIVGTIIRTN